MKPNSVSKNLPTRSDLHLRAMLTRSLVGLSTEEAGRELKNDEKFSFTCSTSGDYHLITRPSGCM